MSNGSTSGASAISVQCINDVLERYRFEVAGEKLHVRLKLCDGPEAIQITHVRNVTSLTM